MYHARLIVFGLTLKSRASSAMPRPSSSRIRRTSARRSAERAGGLPPIRPRLRADARAFFGPLGNPLPFKLGDGGEDVKHQPPGRCGRVDVLGQGPETSAFRADSLHDGQQVLQRTAEAVVLRHRHNIAGAELVKHGGELLSLRLRARKSSLTRCALHPPTSAPQSVASRFWSSVETRAYPRIMPKTLQKLY